jgi:hypothetical protein
MLCIDPNSLKKNRINGVRKDYNISINCRDIKHPLINRKRERGFRKNIISVLQHVY